MDEDIYNQKYRGKLFCINGCKARIKFTEKNDGFKFFSTWNKEITLHDADCPYHGNYQNEIGRKKLEEMHEKQPLNDKHIMNTVRNKFKALKEKIPVEDNIKTSTNRVKNTGTRNIPVYDDNGNISETYKGHVRIGSLDANLMTKDYINLRKCVYGKIKNVYLATSTSGSNYLYINLLCREINLSVYFSEAFYSAENNDIQYLLMFYNKLIKILESKKELIFVGVGFIRPKKNQNGLNLNILDKTHFMINETSYDTIRISGEVKNNKYIYWEL